MIHILQNMNKTTEKLMRLFTDTKCSEIQLSPYVIAKPQENGLLVFSTLTCVLIFMDDVQSVDELCEKAKRDDELRKQLLFCRIFIPKESDEKKFCDQIRSILLIEKKRQLNGKKQGFIIFTTTACNARCYYCFEHGYVPVTMTEETALKTSEYIKNHAKGEVTLTWFGGEPLLNTKAIDIITSNLKTANVPYNSRIVTNSYLFTPELIKTAKEEWNLVSAQITLDGTKENYNRIKNYANGDTDAFTRVIENIKALLENKIFVLLYLTLSRENESDLYALLSELAPMIKENTGYFGISPNLLQQYGGTKDEDEMQQKLIKIQDWMYEKGLMEKCGIPESILINSCTADNPGMAVIQADGGLNCCDHIGESKPYGNISGGIIDQSVVEWWSEKKTALDECENCALYPQCLRLSHCSANNFSCTCVTRGEQLSKITKAMENIFKCNINTLDNK